MALGGLTRILVTLLAVSAAGGATAATKAGQKAAPVVQKPAVPPAPPPLTFTFYDRAIDPVTAAIRDALQTAGREGAFLDKRDAAGVAEYYQEQGYAPTWTLDGRLS